MKTVKQRPLRVFLCHSSSDKPAVMQLYERLVKDGIDAWLDKEKLIPGQEWQIEIPKAVRNSDVVVVCLSSQSITKEGFVQKEIKLALDAADEKPAGTIFFIPAHLETCDVPERINRFHWVDLYSADGYERLLKALQLRAESVGATFSFNSKVVNLLTSEFSSFDKPPNDNIDLSGMWELQETYEIGDEIGDATGVLNLTQTGSLLSGIITTYEKLDDHGGEFVLEQEVQGIVEGKSVSFTGIKVTDDTEVDKWIGNIDNRNLISGSFEGMDGISGEFSLTRSMKK